MKKHTSADSINNPINASVAESHTIESSTESNTIDIGDFEILIDKAKATLSKLSAQEITLKESLALYEEGLANLKKAQDILEKAKLQYQEFKD